jgi:hypothetical protein
VSKFIAWVKSWFASREDKLKRRAEALRLKLVAAEQQLEREFGKLRDKL